MCWSVYPLHPHQAPHSILHLCRVFCNKTLLTRAAGILIFPGSWFGTPGKHFWNISLSFLCVSPNFIFLPWQSQARSIQANRVSQGPSTISIIYQIVPVATAVGQGRGGRWEFILTPENGTTKSLHEFIFPATTVFSVKQDDSSCS